MLATATHIKTPPSKTMILSILLSITFLALAMIHFNWAIGGKFGLAQSIPTKENGEKLFNPGKFESAVIGIGLSAFAIFYWLNAGLLEYNLPLWATKYLSWVIPAIFLLRAIGEFKYIGFFKSVKKTNFARWDTKLFSPLCLIIALFGVIINLIK